MTKQEWLDKRDMFAAHALTGFLAMHSQLGEDGESQRYCAVYAVGVGHHMMIESGYGECPND